MFYLTERSTLSLNMIKFSFRFLTFEINLYI